MAAQEVLLARLGSVGVVEVFEGMGGVPGLKVLGHPH